MLPRAGNGESLLVQQLLDPQYAFDVLTAIHALAGAALHRLELGKFGFPEAQHVGWQLAQPGNFSNAEVEFFRNQYIDRSGLGFGSGSWATLNFQKPYSSQGRSFPSAFLA